MDTRWLPSNRQPLLSRPSKEVTSVEYYAWFDSLSRRVGGINSIDDNKVLFSAFGIFDGATVGPGLTLDRENKILSATGGGFPEAPIDGRIYGRRNAAWTVVNGGFPGPPNRSVQFNDNDQFGGSYTASINTDSNLSIASGGRVTGDWYGGGNVYFQNSNAASNYSYVGVIPRANVGTGSTAVRAHIGVLSNTVLNNSAYQSISVRADAAQHVFGRIVNTSSDVPAFLSWGYDVGSANVTQYGALHNTGNWWFGALNASINPPDHGVKMFIDGALSVNGNASVAGNISATGTGTFGGSGTFGGVVVTPASALGSAGFRLPHGVAPTSPVNGDLWTTTAGLFARINGSTVGPYGTGGGGGTPGGADTQVQYNNAGAFGGLSAVTGNGTAFTLATIAGDIVFTGTARKITGDMSNATVTNRVTFQSSTVNGNTGVLFLPNGTANSSAFALYSSSTAAAGAAVQQCVIAPSTGALWDSVTTDGSGTGEPHRWRTTNSASTTTKMSLFANGNLRIGTTTTDSGVAVTIDGTTTRWTAASARLQGDFTNATVASRAALQSSTTNGMSIVPILPNGTATDVGLTMFAASGATNCAIVQLLCLPGSSLAILDSIATGSGTALNLAFRAGASATRAATMFTTGRWSFGTATAETAGTEMVQIGGSLSISSAVMIRTYTTFTNGAGAASGTLTNAPSAGNPTKWIPVNDNGTTRYIPAW